LLSLIFFLTSYFRPRYGMGTGKPQVPAPTPKVPAKSQRRAPSVPASASSATATKTCIPASTSTASPASPIPAVASPGKVTAGAVTGRGGSDVLLLRHQERLPRASRPRHAAGYGPDGETCGSCSHLHRERIPRRCRPGASRVYLKCDLMREFWNRGRATDVRASDPACVMWKKPND
jgi:hypothetical protein